MGDPTGLVSGFAVEAVTLSIQKILRYINTASRCRQELESLGSLVSTLQGINSDLHKYRVAVNSGRSKPSPNFAPLSLNNWLQELDTLLQEANDMVQHCTIPTFNFVSRYAMSKKITSIIKSIENHKNNASLIQLVQSLSSQVQQFRGEMPASGSSAPVMKGSMYIEEPLVVAQDKALDRLEQLVRRHTLRIGVVGKGGSGKTLLLKRLFNRVENLFSNDLLLWVTVSSTPSFPALRTQFYEQIYFKLNNERPQRQSEEEIKKWLNEQLSEKKFTLFVDDVWETSATRLWEELCVPLPSTEVQHSSVIIASSRSHRALLQLGIGTPAVVDMQNLMEDDSWKLFSCHAFPHTDGNLLESVNENVARNVCKECGDLPLAIKVIGRAMSAVTDLREWEFTLRRLQNAEPIRSAGDVEEYLYDRLRLSYDSLADFHVSLQLCFLYLAAFPEDEVISARSVSLYWIGAGLLREDDVHGTAQTYINLLADRCLIEVVFKDIDGHVIDFRVHDVLHDLARRIGRTEENCFFDAGTGLKDFPDLGAYFRVSLLGKKLTCVPDSLRGPRIRSLIMARNINLQAIPTKVIASMTSLQILDLSETSLQSLPESIGSLKHLTSLHLRKVPIKRLPNSLTSLNRLQVLDLYGSSIRDLPSSIHRLSSLRILDIRCCLLPSCILHGISKLTSLEELRFNSIYSLRVSINDLSALKHLKRLRLFNNGGALINDLSALKRLKKLWLCNNGETIQHGTLGIMTDMEELYLELSQMESLPQDIIAMSKLRVLTLKCLQLTRVDDSFCRFQQLTTLLVDCFALRELPNLHKLASLKQLDIRWCHEIEELPKEFGERGAFPKLEVLNLLWLDKLGELPQVDEAAMPSLQTLSIKCCESLKTLPEGYCNLKSLKKIAISGCLSHLQNLQEEGKLQSIVRYFPKPQPRIVRYVPYG